MNTFSHVLSLKKFTSSNHSQEAPRGIGSTKTREQSKNEEVMEASLQEILTFKGQRNFQEEGKGRLITLLWSRPTGQAVQTRARGGQMVPRWTYPGGKNINYQLSRDFPCGPVVKTPHSQCRGPRFAPVRELDPTCCN